ncbi:MAG: hypothetical protein OYG31_02755 [Candidatus Kaiserbacteria bacterium]|nr:hypothetical protein [Candidatus Kaiserbacteria bacterium]
MKTTVSIQLLALGVAAIFVATLLTATVSPAVAVELSDDRRSVDAMYLCAYFGVHCPMHSNGLPIGVNNVLSSIANVDIIQDRILRHRKTGTEYVARNFRPLLGTIYLNRLTGTYVAEEYLEEVPGTGLMHKHTGEIILSSDFDEVDGPVYRDSQSGLYITEQGMAQALESTIVGVKNEIASYVERVGDRTP